MNEVITGVVIDGNKRGKRLGFPTLNVAMPEGVLVPDGIYISKVAIEGILYKSLTFIGPAKTYGETTYQSETYVFNFNRDIYGQKVTITLLQKIRDNERFMSEEKLIGQMEKDKKQAIEYFENLSISH